jgi:hypothetical protein
MARVNVVSRSYWLASDLFGLLTLTEISDVLHMPKAIADMCEEETTAHAVSSARVHS